MSWLKYIGKATDSDLVETLTNKFNDMSKAESIEEFYGYEGRVLELLKDLKEGNERSTRRSWFGSIWGFIESFRKSEGTMMSVLRKVDTAESWYEKLAICSNHSMIDDELISSRWTRKVRDAAKGAWKRIGEIVKLPDTVGKESKDKAYDPDKQERVIHLLRDVFSYEGSNLKVELGGEKYEDEKSKLGNKIPLLPAERGSLTGEYVNVVFTDYLRAVFDIKGKRIKMTKSGNSISISQSE